MHHALFLHKRQKGEEVCGLLLGMAVRRPNGAERADRGTAGRLGSAYCAPWRIRLMPFCRGIVLMES